MWDITKAKFYNEIMTSVAHLLGFKDGEATEAEIQEKLDGVGQLNELIETRIQESQVAFSNQIAALQVNIESLSEQVQTLQSAVAERNATISSLNEQLEALEAKRASQSFELEDMREKNKQVSGELATLKLGRLPNEQVPGFDGATIRILKDTNGSVVDMKAIEAALGIKTYGQKQQ